MWAVVDPNGTLVRNKGAASALKISTGQYQVVFNQDVTGCSYQATVGDPGNSAQIGYATAQQRVNVNAGVYVLTWNQAGAIADKPFHVAVFC